MEIPIYTVDAFTDTPFSGNPAAVCLLSGKTLDDDKLQKIASEMNLSETAYISFQDDQGNYSRGSRFGLRWFTPHNEVKLCGHATLASAAVLFNCIENTSSEIKFDTLSGTLSAVRDRDRISIFLPECKPHQVKESEVQELIEAMFTDYKHLKPIDIQLSSTLDYLMLRLPDICSRSEFEKLRFDFNKLLSAKTECKVDSVTITLKGSRENGCVDDKGAVYDFVSRFFTPWYGIPEDPVTGSAHSVLAPYWSEELQKTSFYARQCSERGGELTAELLGNGQVKLTGSAALVLRGTIYVK